MARTELKLDHTVGDYPAIRCPRCDSDSCQTHCGEEGGYYVSPEHAYGNYGETRVPCNCEICGVLFEIVIASDKGTSYIYAEHGNTTHEKYRR